jgi:hypothetical protein
MEMVDHDGGVRQDPADRGHEDGTHVDRDVPDPFAPPGRLAGQPVRHIIAGAALDLGQHPLSAADIGEPDMPAVGQHPRLRRLTHRYHR